MKKIGGYIAFFGALAIVLNFFDRVPKILMWIYNWGDSTAWAIKIGLVIIGLAIYFLAGNSKKDSEETEPKE
ncbi:MAG: hypothetical protein AB8B78_04485 [Polaribacter sp.]